MSKNKVLKTKADRIPDIRDGIGIWTKEQIIQMVIRGDEGKALEQSLKTAIDKFYEPSQLEQMANYEITTTTASKSDLKQKTSRKRVTVHLGLMKQQELKFPDMLFEEDGIKKKKKETFYDLLRKFYEGFFDDNEKVKIAKALQDESVIHIAVYNHVKTKSKNVFWEKNELIAAASFLIPENQMASLVLYMCVSNLKFEKTQTRPPKDVNNPSIATPETTVQKNYKLGSFLLCMIQKIHYDCRGNNFNILAEVNVQIDDKTNQDIGPTKFYRKNFCKAVNQKDPENPIIYEYRDDKSKRLFT